MSGPRRLRTAAILLPALLLPLAAQASPLEQAILAYEHFDYDRSLQLLAEVKADAETSTADKARASLYAGLVYFSKGQPEIARQAFVTALALDSRLVLPPGISPRIAALVESLRPPLVTAEVTAAPATVPHPVDTAPGPAGDQRTKSNGAKIGAWSLTGIGAAAAAAGVVLFFVAHQTHDQAVHAAWADDASRLSSKSQRQQSAAIALTVAGGALFIAGGAWHVALALYPSGAGLAVATER